jgi:hypothetical protein
MESIMDSTTSFYSSQKKKMTPGGWSLAKDATLSSPAAVLTTITDKLVFTHFTNSLGKLVLRHERFCGFEYTFFCFCFVVIIKVYKEAFFGKLYDPMKSTYLFLHVTHA